jgi:two-component system sensor histidine kinase RegB
LVKSVPPLRHVVASLPAVRAITCAALWSVLTAVAVLPGIDLPLRRIWPLILAAAICRTGRIVSTRLPSVERTFAGLSLCADALLLTGLLDITGGPFNPFIVLYVVFVWLAAADLSRAWAGAVAVIALTASSWLVMDHLQHLGAEHHRLNDFPTHLFTMWLSGVAVAELVVHYVSLANRAIAERQREADEAKARALRSEHVASLMTLAAGAAHELSTPLGTIALAARELERAAGRQPGSAAFKEDARLIRTEVDRCQIILERMSGRAGSGVPEVRPLVPPDELARLAAAALTDAHRHRLDVQLAEGSSSLVAVPEAAGAISSLLKNAFDASADDSRVVLRIVPNGSTLHIEVRDRGCGMSPEVMRRAGEPFFTTKKAGRGLGLGVFLARTFAERTGGMLWFEQDGGTVAILELPARSEVAVA